MAAQPGITEKEIPSQEGRVFLITGGYAGVGYELSKILYHLNGKVYIAGRSKDKAQAAIASIKASSPSPEQVVPSGKGSLHFLHLDLADLTTIASTARTFLAMESRLDIIWHNAAVMVPPDGSTTAQGHDLQLGTNALGHFLLQHLLTPVILHTASLPGVPPLSTRVIFLSSTAVAGSPRPDGVNWADPNMLDGTGFAARLRRYGQSKAMSCIYAREFARRHGLKGVASLSVDPGRLSTGLQKDLPWWVDAMMRWWRHPPRMGALTELYAGFCDLDDRRNGAFIQPYGRFGVLPDYIEEGLERRGTGDRLWKMSEELVRPYRDEAAERR